VTALRRLFNEQLDFLGISAYAPYNLRNNGVPLSEFENSAFILCEEMLNSYGIDIKEMANSGKLELQYSEFGIGGGASYQGNQVRIWITKEEGMPVALCQSRADFRSASS
jgi:hypothetical protein